MLIEKVLWFFISVTLFIGLLSWLGYTLIKRAKRRKTVAVIFAAAVQMLLPDPYAERTIQVVQEQKKEHHKQQENGDPDNRFETDDS